MGCGWLGLPLAKMLIKQSHNIVATRRSVAGIDELSELGISGVKFELGLDLQQTQFDLLFTSDILFLNIPVGRKSVQSFDFIRAIESLLIRAQQSQIKQVLFVSSTSIYGDESRQVTENSTPNPITHSANVNFAVEKLVSNYFPKNFSILRLAGLVGETRHPVYFLSGKTGLTQPKQVVNLVHQQDVLKAIQNILDKGLWGKTFILSATEHPSREEYYTWAAETLNLPIPQFISQENNEKGKQIDASASLARLGIELTYTSPYQMLQRIR